MSPLFAGFYLSRWACSASCFLQSCSDVQWTWIYSKIFPTLCWLPMETNRGFTPRPCRSGLRPLGWASVRFGGAHGVWKSWFTCSISSPQSWLGWALLLTEESLRGVRLMDDLMQPWLLEMHLSLKILCHHKSELNEISVPAVGFVRWKYTERWWGGLVARFGNEWLIASVAQTSLAFSQAMRRKGLRLPL